MIMYNKYLPWTRHEGQTYTAVVDKESDCDSESLRHETGAQVLCLRSKSALYICILTVSLLIYSCTVNTLLYLSSTTPSTPKSTPLHTSQCIEPSTRREMRSLSTTELLSYRSAVMCLETLPSKVGLNNSLWDDFPYVHIWHGHDSHDAVSFFAWHRWLLHIYETALRDQCGYEGPMIYWDWTLDWEAPYDAPVFDPDTAWGGDGDPERPGWRGGCVKDGPLGGHIMPYIGYWLEPHCLSRNFTTPGSYLYDFWRYQWQPERLEELLQIEELDDFVRQLEPQVHRALPELVGGDYSERGAPVDPLFFLHHCQLDRIYWSWQQRDPQKRLHTYRGRKTELDVHDTAQITDTLYYQDLGPTVSVGEILDIQGTRLCYQYEQLL